MSTRLVEFLEPVRLGHTQYEIGDRKAFPAEEAGEYIRLGWVKDAITEETGERKPGAQKIHVDNLVQQTS